MDHKLKLHPKEITIFSTMLPKRPNPIIPSLKKDKESLKRISVPNIIFT